MNCERVRQLWDEYRDGTVHGVEAHGLEQHLADCAKCEKLWRRESAWLNVLGEKTPIEDRKPDAFTSAVVRRWERSLGQPTVVARITRLSAAAAVIAIMLSLAAVMVDRGETRPGGPAAGRGEVDSVGVLIAGIQGPTTAIRQTFDRTASLLDVGRYTETVVGFLDAAAPPPTPPASPDGERN